ncbi:uncharacterized protein LOC112568576 [Pomacea canaliculata]|uniref:uncharacterized protein LOC112568576 n=1 Tax=Pomacea canaliculata TaxID=400727 RepID=UPI000D73E750|nr:uncharacterized protein LOC112568576 [Pomacea canaliculata]
MKIGMKRLVYLLLHLIHWISCSQDVCARLKFENATRDVLQVFDNDLINITFYLDTTNCSGNHSYIVTVASGVKNDLKTMDICKVIFQNGTYMISDNSYSCHLCSSKDKIKFCGQAGLQLTKLIFSVTADNVKHVDTVIQVNVTARNASLHNGEKIYFYWSLSTNVTPNTLCIMVDSSDI